MSEHFRLPLCATQRLRIYRHAVEAGPVCNICSELSDLEHPTLLLLIDHRLRRLCLWRADRGEALGVAEPDSGYGRAEITLHRQGIVRRRQRRLLRGRPQAQASREHQSGKSSQVRCLRNACVEQPPLPQDVPHSSFPCTFEPVSFCNECRPDGQCSCRLPAI